LLAVAVLTGMVQVETSETYLLGAGDRQVFGQEKRETERRPRPPMVIGIVDEVKDGKLTVLVGRRATPTAESYNIGATVKVSIDGKAGKLADLVKGTLVRLEKNDKGELVAIHTEGPSVAGTVKSVGDGKIVLQNRVRNIEGGSEQSFAVPERVKVVVDGRPAKLTDLKTGTAVLVKLSMDRKSVLVITALPVRAAGQVPTVAGKIKAIDVKANTITLSSLRGGGADQTFTLGENVSVRVDGKPGKVSDLAVGNSVLLVLEQRSKTVRAITVGSYREVAIVSPPGVIRTLEGDKLTVQVNVRGGDGQEETYTVGDTVRVFVDNKPAKLASLKKGMYVRLAKNEKGGLIGIRAEGQTMTGVLKEIKDGRLTLVGRGFDALLVVGPQTKVNIDREPAKLADLKPETRIILTLSVDGKTVLMIAANTGRGEGRRQSVLGEVKAIDTKAGTVRLVVKTGGRGAEKPEERTYTLGKEVKVMIDGKQGSLAEIKTGTTAMLLLDGEGKTVQGIVVRISGERRREKQE
jgi:hypothetical protein